MSASETSLVRDETGQLAIAIGSMRPVALRLEDEAIERRLNKKDALLRAVKAFGRERPPFVVDATAGLGRDTGLLLSVGCRVLACEKNELLSALWQEVSRENLEFIAGSAENVLMDFENKTRSERPDVVYLDPMFPLSKKNVGVTRESQVMRALAQPDEAGARALLSRGLRVCDRVVIKRKKGSPSLLSLDVAVASKSGAPSFAIDAGKVRYDVYLSVS